jgi:hypothetical protein
MCREEFEVSCGGVVGLQVRGNVIVQVEWFKRLESLKVLEVMGVQ